jgi:two-component system chemotaxis response regulator CheY
MPEMDGITLIKKLRENSAHKGTPILVLTTEGGEDMKQSGREAGATGWIVKPFDPAILESAVNKVCGC